ncbi:MAG: hypothetical protein WDN66_00295 [Candidatus Saccharibacteria bacterium]
MFGEILNDTTAITTALGYLGGEAIEFHSAHALAKQPGLTGTIENAEQSPDALARIARFTHLTGPLDKVRQRYPITLKHFVGTLGLAGAMFGYSTGAFISTEASIDRSPSTLAYAIDDSSTVLESNNFSEINQVAQNMNSVNTKDLVVKSFLDHYSNVEPISLGDLPQYKPFGDTENGGVPVMATTVGDAINSTAGNSNVNVTNLLGAQSKEKDGGIVVFDNDDDIGDIQAADPERIPLYIVEFGADNSALSVDASITGGQYFLASNYKDNPTAIANALKGAIKTEPISEKSNNNR